MKSRPSGEKRRKELARQERNREKEARRRARKQARLDNPQGTADADVVGAEAPVISETESTAEASGGVQTPSGAELT